MAIDNEIAREIYDTYAQYVLSSALFLTGSRSVADDVAQDSFVRIFRSYDGYDQSKPIKPWIYKIVVNTARTALKRRSKRRTVPLDFDVSSQELVPIDALLEDERRDALLRAMNNISLKSKEVLVLRYFNNLSLSEISEALSIPMGTCKSRLSTAIRQLRKALPDDLAFQYKGGEELEEH